MNNRKTIREELDDFDWIRNEKASVMDAVYQSLYPKYTIIFDEDVLGVYKVVESRYPSNSHYFTIDGEVEYTLEDIVEIAESEYEISIGTRYEEEYWEIYSLLKDYLDSIKGITESNDFD